MNDEQLVSEDSEIIELSSQFEADEISFSSLSEEEKAELKFLNELGY